MGIPLRWLFESRGIPSRVLSEQMREAGLDPGRVRWVVISHLHGDHTGAADSFTGATFLGGPGTATSPLAAAVAPRWLELRFGTEAKPWPPFDASIDLFGDGSIRLFHGGGHTAEDLLALVALPDGPALLAGDAVVHRDWLRSDDVQRIASNRQRAADVRNQVRALVAATPNLVLFPGHDLSEVPLDRADVAFHHPEWAGATSWPISP